MVSVCDHRTMGRYRNKLFDRRAVVISVVLTTLFTGCSKNSDGLSAPPAASERDASVVSWNLGNDTFASALAVYANGDAIVAGHHQAAGQVPGIPEVNGFVQRLNKRGDKVFSTKFGGSEAEDVRALIVDAEDNAWLATIDDDQTSGRSGSLHKFDAQGKLAFTSLIECWSCTTAIGTNAAGELWLGGERLLSSPDGGLSVAREGRLQKFSRHGELLLATSFGEAESTVGGPLFIDDEGDVWVFGAQTNDLTSFRWTATVFHFSSEGAPLGRFEVESQRSALPAALRIDDAQTLWLATSELDDESVYFTLRGYSKDGKRLFAHEEKTLLSPVLTIAPSGNVWSMSTDAEPLLREYTSDGRVKRTVSVDALSAVPWGAHTAVAFDPQSGVWFAGGATLTDGFAFWHEPL